jgi:hypothetical protein
MVISTAIERLIKPLIIGGIKWVNGISGVDKTTNTLQIIDYAHHEIHAGSHFIYTDSVALNSSEAQVYLITTPNSTKYAHMLFDLDGSAITQFDLYEDSDRVGTTLQTVGNNNRNSSTAATVTIHKGITGGSTDGRLIHTYKGGGASAQARSASIVRNDEELILKRNTKYLLRLTSGTNSNLTNVRLEWYEHIDKNT